MQKIRKILSAVFPEKWWQIRATLLTVTLLTQRAQLQFLVKICKTCSSSFSRPSQHLGICIFRPIQAILGRSNRLNFRKQAKTYFWLVGSFKNWFLWFLNGPGNATKSWKTFSTITICNIKSIQQTKLKKMAQNLYFGSLDHSKTHFEGFWMTRHDLVVVAECWKTYCSIKICNIKWTQQT